MAKDVSLAKELHHVKMARTLELLEEEPEMALKLLKELKDPAKLEELMEMFEQKGVRDVVRYRIAGAFGIILGTMGEKEKPLFYDLRARVVSLLEKTVSDKNEDYKVRRTAAAALGVIGDQESASVLSKLLKDTEENPLITEEAAWAYQRISIISAGAPMSGL